MSNGSDFVRVFATDELALYMFAKSLLDRDRIEYLTRGEQERNVTGWAPVGWIEVVRGPAELWVRREDAERARATLEGIGTNVAADPDDSADA